MMDEPTHCSKCGAKLEPPRMSPGPPGSGREMLGGWYTAPGSKDPLCPKCAQVDVYLRQQSRETLRLQIMRGTQDEVLAAFEELMRRNMEEGNERKTGTIATGAHIVDWMTEEEALYLMVKTCPHQEKAEKWDSFMKQFPDIALKEQEHIELLLSKHNKLEAVKALAPEILSWMATGVDWACSESSGGGRAERKMQVEHNELASQFKELLGIEEVMKICSICGWRGEEAEVLPDDLLRCPICGKVLEKAEGS